MWKLIFHVTCVFDPEYNSSEVKRTVTRTVTSEELFEAIHCGCFERNGFFSFMGNEGRSPRRGIRVFENVTMFLK